VHAANQREFSRAALRFRLLGRTRAQAVTGDSEQSGQKDASCHVEWPPNPSTISQAPQPERGRKAAPDPREAGHENTEEANFR
jgi:hypothetical protein